jgi:hypothetical protein
MISGLSPPQGSLGSGRQSGPEGDPSGDRGVAPWDCPPGSPLGPGGHASQPHTETGPRPRLPATGVVREGTQRSPVPDGTGVVVLRIRPGQRELTICYPSGSDKVTGAGAEWSGDGLDVAGMNFGLWVPGVDYIARWREAREAADRLNRAFLGMGFELSELRAVASTNDDGRGVVRLAGWPGAMERLARLLEARLDSDGGAA